MKIGKLAGRRAPPRRQRGLVLLITLIVLVAMMLAGIGMMRSIDTTTMIAGNIAFRESTLHAGDAGMDTVYKKLMQITSVQGDKIVLNYDDSTPAQIALDPLNPGVLTNLCPGLISAYLCNANNTTNFLGYKSTPINACEIYPPGSAKQCPTAAMYQWWTTPANWNNAPFILVTDPNAAPGAPPVATVYYLVQRMCELAGKDPSDNSQTCQAIQENVNVTGSSMQVGTTKYTATSIYYRITTKSVGPRNTVTYAQELVLVPE